MTKEMTGILLEQAESYPEMQPADAVKLIFQNEFGGGHLIRDPQACLEYLRREYAAVRKDPAVPRYEDIGNGILRVHLAALPETDLEALGQRFLRSAAAHHGSMEGFLKKLETLRALTARGIFSFDGEALGEYLAAYAQAGYPAVSHSPEYRRAYAPAYRIVLAREMQDAE